MPEDKKNEPVQAAPVERNTPKPSEREKQLEQALKDAVVIVEDQAVRLQRMGIGMKGTAEWVALVKELLAGGTR